MLIIAARWGVPPLSAQLWDSGTQGFVHARQTRYQLSPMNLLFSFLPLQL